MAGARRVACGHSITASSKQAGQRAEEPPYTVHTEFVDCAAFVFRAIFLRQHRTCGENSCEFSRDRLDLISLTT